MSFQGYYKHSNLYVDTTPATILRQLDINRQIHALYDSGVPFFTKQKIHDLNQQLRSLKGKPGKVSVTGLSGTVAEFTIDPVHVLPLDEDTDLEWIV
jgi:hypothetical protein